VEEEEAISEILDYAEYALERRLIKEKFRELKNQAGKNRKYKYQ